jgi:branched-chain amino acid transport system ATP-binding protein
LAIGGVVARRRIKQETDKVYELLPALQAKRRDRADSLSGGQQQMLAIGQALMSTPRYLCLDEPSLGLAPVVFGEVARLISDLAASGVGIVWAEQFPEVAKARSSQVVLLSAGMVTASGPPAQISEEQLEAAYLGTRAQASPVS